MFDAQRTTCEHLRVPTAITDGKMVSAYFGPRRAFYAYDFSGKLGLEDTSRNSTRSGWAPTPPPGRCFENPKVIIQRDQDEKPPWSLPTTG